MLSPFLCIPFLCILLSSCDLLVKDQLETFIPGIYTRHYKDEYTDSYDTIWIQSISDDEYIVTKKSSFYKLNDQNIPVPGYEIKKWQATYDNGSGMLFLPAPGKPVLFDMKNSQLRIGTEPYKKLKQ